MAQSNKHDAVMEWLLKSPQVQHLYFQFGQDVVNSITLSPSDKTIKSYIDGSSDRQYLCELIWYLPASNEADSTNIEAMLDIDALNDWFKAQDEAENYPDFPEGCTVEELTVIDSSTGYVATEDGVLAKYIVPFSFNYHKQA